jgi:mono/diheme cytochrome c family protein
VKRSYTNALAALLCGLAFAGCSGTDEPTLPGREYVKDMIDSVPYDSFAENPVLKDGKTLQAPAPGSIPRGWEPFDYGATPAEALRAGAELKNPLPNTPANLERGDKVFHTVCFTCHGDAGKGDGPVAGRFPTPPSLLLDHAKGLPDGQIFHIITRGQGLMPPHYLNVRVEDRWKVVHYIRKLQASGGVQ